MNPTSAADGQPRRVCTSLHGCRLLPLDAPPIGPAWNLDELADLLPSTQARIQAAVLIAIIERSSGPQVLLTRRTDHLSQHAGQVSFPGGRVEPSDSGPLGAALRETFEELGITPDRVQPLGFLDPYDTITGYRVTPVLATLADDYIAVPDPGEVAEAFEVPLDFLLDPANCEIKAADYRGRMRHYSQFRFGRHLVWGATAAMLVNLRQRLRGA